jgi:hypothetical protein
MAQKVASLPSSNGLYKAVHGIAADLHGLCLVRAGRYFRTAGATRSVPAAGGGMAPVVQE